MSYGDYDLYIDTDSEIDEIENEIDKAIIEFAKKIKAIKKKYPRIQFGEDTMECINVAISYEME